MANSRAVDIELLCVCFQAEDGIRYLVRSRGLGDVYKRQGEEPIERHPRLLSTWPLCCGGRPCFGVLAELFRICLLYTSDAADERSSVDLGGRRIIKKKKPNRLMEILRLESKA